MIAAVIPAAGQGQRMGPLPVPSKQMLNLSGVPVIVRTLQVFQAVPEIQGIALVVPEELQRQFQQLVDLYRCSKVHWIVPGGKSRQESVFKGLAALPEDCRFVVIHDGGRPLVTVDMIQYCLQQVFLSKAVSAAVPVKDTIKVSWDGKVVHKTLDRSTLWQVQTPQAFAFPLIKHLHESAREDGVQVTDDAALAEHYGYTVHLVQGSYDNLKLTTSEDVVLAEAILNRRSLQKTNQSSQPSHAPAAGPFPAAGFVPASQPPVFRTGVGYDVHRLVEGRELILCGVKIPYTHGLLGHSDADVALHALMDSLLGGAALGDIGRHFPDSDEAYRDISSMKLLEHVMSLLVQRSFTVVNIDVTIVAQRPKLAPYIETMRLNIASVCQIPVDRVNVKATTTEGLGFTGRSEGIAAYATCLLLHGDNGSAGQ